MLVWMGDSTLLKLMRQASSCSARYFDGCWATTSSGLLFRTSRSAQHTAPHCTLRRTAPHRTRPHTCTARYAAIPSDAAAALAGCFPQESAVSALRLADIRNHQEQLRDDPTAQLSRVSNTHMLECAVCQPKGLCGVMSTSGGTTSRCRSLSHA
jgi:hypothetical protein